MLFAASVRRNIDAFNEHTDNTLWAVLQEVSLGFPYASGIQIITNVYTDTPSVYSACHTVGCDRYA